MNADKAIQTLIEELDFEPRTARTYVRANGYCEYCGEELIRNRLGYACAQIDHLLPRSKFPAEVYELENNFVLSCSLCNSLKSNISVLQENEDPMTMLTKQRHVLLARAKDEIVKQLKEPNRKWEIAKSVFGRNG